jgi:hypothetical protein
MSARAGDSLWKGLVGDDMGMQAIAAENSPEWTVVYHTPDSSTHAVLYHRGRL